MLRSAVHHRSIVDVTRSMPQNEPILGKLIL
jgi:hypothetical protein